MKVCNKQTVTNLKQCITYVLYTVSVDIFSFLLRDALWCKVRSCDRMSSVCPSGCNVGGSGPHRLEILETNCTDN